jgi:hypothetical protein
LKTFDFLLVLVHLVLIQQAGHPLNSAYPFWKKGSKRIHIMIFKETRWVTKQIVLRKCTCKWVIKENRCRWKGSQPSQRHCPGYTSFPPCSVAAW